MFSDVVVLFHTHQHPVAHSQCVRRVAEVKRFRENREKQPDGQIVFLCMRVMSCPCLHAERGCAALTPLLLSGWSLLESDG